MAKRKARKKDDSGYSFIYAQVTKYTAAVDSSVNYEARDDRWRHSDTKVYSFQTRLEIEARCLYPEDAVDEKYYFTIYGGDRHAEELSQTVKDCHAIDDKWQRVYRTVKGQQVPVYNIPKGLVGSLDRRRGEKAWNGWANLTPQAVSDMMLLLSRMDPLYIQVHRYKENKLYYMNGFTLQTAHPDEA